MDKNNKKYVEDYDPHIQEVMIELIASIVENMRNKKQEENQNEKSSNLCEVE